MKIKREEGSSYAWFQSCMAITSEVGASILVSRLLAPYVPEKILPKAAASYAVFVLGYSASKLAGRESRNMIDHLATTIERGTEGVFNVG